MIHHEGRVEGGTPFLAEGHIEFKLPDLQIHEILPWLAFDTKKPFEPVEPDIGSLQIAVRRSRAKPGASKPRGQHETKRDIAVQEAKA